MSEARWVPDEEVHPECNIANRVFRTTLGREFRYFQGVMQYFEASERIADWRFDVAPNREGESDE